MQAFDGDAVPTCPRADPLSPQPLGAQKGEADGAKRNGKKERGNGAQAGSKRAKRYLEATDTPTACKHNRWTLQAKKKRFYLFRCLVCSKLWKTKFRTTQKCADFFVGHCPRGDECPFPHIYSSNRKGPNIKTSLESFRAILNPDDPGAPDSDADSDVEIDIAANFDLGAIVAALGESDSVTASDGEGDTPSPPAAPTPNRAASPAHTAAAPPVAAATAPTPVAPAPVQPAAPAGASYVLTSVPAQTVQQFNGPVGVNYVQAPMVKYAAPAAPAQDPSNGGYTVSYAPVYYSYAPPPAAPGPVTNVVQSTAPAMPYASSMLTRYNLDDSSQAPTSCTSSAPTSATSGPSMAVHGYSLDVPSPVAYSVPVYTQPVGATMAYQTTAPLPSNEYAL
eukprot:TRINITY_DN18821_c0_g1_i1.p1 TRINITY_DN18821_c0_g1~~TRINITY_DN18821_c0_g1_i1.p1  ORF type:complete len:393 (+),score=76.73 TRINITY_DN18821_c0_g1_i1:55-1233(+)